MGIAKLEFRLNLPTIADMKASTVASILAALPKETRVVGVEHVDGKDKIFLEHPAFKDGADIMPSFTRDCAVIDGKVIEIDYFSGIDLKGCLIDER